MEENLNMSKAKKLIVFLLVLRLRLYTCPPKPDIFNGIKVEDMDSRVMQVIPSLRLGNCFSVSKS